MRRWWHERVLRHTVTARVAWMHDLALLTYWSCSCGKEWTV